MLNPDLNPLENRGYGTHPPSITGLRAAFYTSGAVSSDAGTQTVLFALTANCADPASFTCTVRDGRPAPASANVSLTVNALAPAARTDSSFVTGCDTAASITRPSIAMAAIRHTQTAYSRRQRSLQAAVGLLGDNSDA